MRTTIDQAGRIVIPKHIRDQVGIVPGPVDVHVVGNVIHIELPADDIELTRDDHGFLVIPAQDAPTMSDDELRDLRLRMQDPTGARGERDD